jgi:hypothetical protein
MPKRGGQKQFLSDGLPVANEKSKARFSVPVVTHRQRQNLKIEKREHTKEESRYMALIILNQRQRRRKIVRGRQNHSHGITVNNQTREQLNK